MDFKDHFSAQAQVYRDYRPRYPRELFAWLATITKQHELAWDCATGNGQAALGVADFFHQVVASDASEKQIEHAESAGNVEYRVASAEASGLADHSADLITVAQAYHWFDHPAFHREAQRVLRAGGVLAVWTYHMALTADPQVNALLAHYYHEIVGPYWPPERQLLENDFQGIAFPFQVIPSPKFELSMLWTKEQLLGYLRSWSATQAYQRASGQDPLEQIRDELHRLWSGRESLQIQWPIHMRVGRVEL